MRLNQIMCCLLTGAVLAGCKSQPTPQKLTREPDPPPSYPAKKDVPIDPQACATAKREVLTALQSNDPIVRANAVEAVQDGMGAQGKEHILAALNDPEPIVRFSGSMAAGKLRLAEAKSQLLSMAQDKDPSVRVGVRFALHRIGDTRLSHDFETYAADTDPRVRGNTALALGLLGEPSAMRVLMGMTKDRSPLVRFQVAEARWQLHDLGGAADLIAGTVSGYPDDQMFCILALASPRDARVMQHVRGKLTSDYPEISLIAARAVGMLGSDAGYGVAMIGAKSPDPRQRVMAVMAFGDIGRTDAQPMLSKGLQDNQQSVRLAAATAQLKIEKR